MLRRRVTETVGGLRKTRLEESSVSHYEVKVKPLLNKLRPLKQGMDKGALADLKAAIDAAAKAGATAHDIASAVGGSKEWNKIVRALKKAKLV